MEAPAFPSLDSIQRSGGQSAAASRAPPTLVLPDDQAGDANDSDDEVAAAKLTASSVEVDPARMPAPPSTVKAAPVRSKVHIKPGYSQLDWAKLQKSGKDLRNGVKMPMRVTPSMLAEHRSINDCWQAYNGKVYDVTAFLRFHPGGVKQLMRVAGADGTQLFMETHRWVNVDMMLDGCLVGFLVRDE